MHSDPAQSCCPVGVKVGTVLGLNVGLTGGEELTDVGFTEGEAVGLRDGLLVVGFSEGENVVGIFVGLVVRVIVGRIDGENEGTLVGAKVGIKVVGMAVRMGLEIG